MMHSQGEKETGRPIMSLRNISKYFGGVQALSNVDIDIRQGEVIALVGDNGAGKSTLLKVMSGVNMIDTGQIEFEGKPVKIHNTIDSVNLGIQTVYQELALCDNLNAIQNMFLGRELSYGGKRIDEAQMETITKECLDDLGIEIDSLHLPVGQFSGGQRQAVAIARAMLGNPKVVLLDEPLANLGYVQRKQVSELIKRLRSRNVGVVVVSHDLEEVFEVSDRVVVMRLGKQVAEFEKSEISHREVVAEITGSSEFSEERTISERGIRAGAEPIMEIKELNKHYGGVHAIENVSFDIFPGELLYVVGDNGAGKSSLVNILSGATLPDAGSKILYKKQETELKNPAIAQQKGIKTVYQDLSLCDNLNAFQNIYMGNEITNKSRLHTEEMQRTTMDLFEEIGSNVPNPGAAVGTRSGGQRQAVAIAKAILKTPEVIFMDEPTAALGVIQRKQVSKLSCDLRDKGCAVVVVSQDLGEVVQTADRVIVMRLGRIATILTGDSITRENMVAHITGVATA